MPATTSTLVLPTSGAMFSLETAFGAMTSGGRASAAAAVGTSIETGAAVSAAAVRVSPPTRSTTTSSSTPPSGSRAPGKSDGSTNCSASGHAAVVDRASQRGWLCTDGTADVKFPITTAVSQPEPGTYHVYAKESVTTSTFGGHFSYLDNFVAFAFGTTTGARIGFHAVPHDAAGVPYQPLDTVGTPGFYGASSGCIRVLPAQSQTIWNFLAAGDTVVVIS